MSKLRRLKERDKGERDQLKREVAKRERGRRRERLREREKRKSCPEASFLCLRSAQGGQQQCHTQLKTFSRSQEAHLDFSE